MALSELDIQIEEGADFDSVIFYGPEAANPQFSFYDPLSGEQFDFSDGWTAAAEVRSSGGDLLLTLEVDLAEPGRVVLHADSEDTDGVALGSRWDLELTETPPAG